MSFNIIADDKAILCLTVIREDLQTATGDALNKTYQYMKQNN